MRWSLFVLIISMGFGSAHAKEPAKKESPRLVFFNSGFGTGNDFRAMSEEDREMFAAGFFDGLLCAPFFKAPAKEMEWLDAFAKGKTPTQISAIIKKSLDKTPENWDQPLNSLAWKAIWLAARKNGESEKSEP